MQTFLPYFDFNETAKSLDRARLGKQRVECKQILSCLLGIGSDAWKNHPAVKMWKGHENALAFYTLAICDEWRRRGYRDSIREWVFKEVYTRTSQNHEMPPWLGDERLHHSHRSNLFRKDPVHYARAFLGSTYDSTEPYWWPTKEMK